MAHSHHTGVSILKRIHSLVENVCVFLSYEIVIFFFFFLQCYFASGGTMAIKQAHFIYSSDSVLEDK